MFPLQPTIRRGISLLEVLISMGILTVGLASVLALIPAGKSQARKAAIDDGRGSLGSAALADVVNRGLLRPSIWSTPAATAIVYDPLFQYATGATASFPTGLTSISLGNIAGAATDEVCRGQDDLVYPLPDDEEAPALPAFFSTGKRQTEGYFSWMATMVPAQAGANPEYYRLSIVEFHKRPFDSTSGASWISFGVASSDWYGTSVTIGIPTNTNVPLSKEQFGDFFKAGTVVLVSDKASNHRWLRVLMAAPDESVDGSTVTSVDLTFDQDPLFTPTILYVYAGAVGVAEQIVRLEGESPWVTP